MKMTKVDYAQEIASRVGGEVREVEKANGVVLTGITLVTNSNVQPTLYIDDMYRNDVPVDEAVDKVNDAFRNANKKIDIDWITDYEVVKDKLTARLFNKRTSADVSRSAKDYGFDDLIIVPYIVMKDIGGACKVTAHMLGNWGVTEDEVIDTALQNSANEYTVGDMMTMLFGDGPVYRNFDDVEDVNNMLVVSNLDKSFGAIGVVVAKDAMDRKYENGYVVIPSSVHECIVLPYNGNENAFNSMVADVNEQEVAAEEVLSDHAYFFRGVGVA